MPPSFRHVAVPGGDLACWSRGEGPALVFLHGWALDARVWAKQEAAFAYTFRVVTYDRRGFGASSAPAALTQEATDLADVLDAHGIADAAVIGLSQGARVALDFALKHPVRTRALVLVGAPIPGAPPESAAGESLPLDAMKQLARSQDWTALERAWLAEPLLAFADADPGAVALLRSMARGYRARDLLDQSPPLLLDLERLEAIQAPTLVLTGANDGPARQEAGDLVAKRIPHAVRNTIPDAGHLCNLHRPNVFNAVLRQFLRSHPPATA